MNATLDVRGNAKVTAAAVTKFEFAWVTNSGFGLKHCPFVPALSSVDIFL